MAEKKYIEREALIEHIRDLPTWWADSGGVYGQAMKYPEGMFDCDDVINSVANAPAADVVEVVHGEWLEVQYTYFGAKRYECSQCRDDEFWKKRYIEIKENYCPNCGAKMDGERKCKNG